jgi:hypothetical protein
MIEELKNLKLYYQKLNRIWTTELSPTVFTAQRIAFFTYMLPDV